ncbi:MAG: aminoacyl-tRNA hydrolase [Proteobacteria bacterium]|nr:MAG: aminoacyl-tRNA hydrolase [Pseudomonadota bacterium]
MLKVTDKINIPWDEMEISYARSGGPGGQNVNKRETKAVLSWNPKESPSLTEEVRARFLDKFSSRISEDGHMVIASDEHRSQDMNLKSCFEKLANMIRLVAIPPKIRRATRPTKGSKIRRVAGKKIQSETKKNRQKVHIPHD